MLACILLESPPSSVIVAIRIAVRAAIEGPVIVGGRRMELGDLRMRLVGVAVMVVVVLELLVLVLVRMVVVVVVVAAEGVGVARQLRHHAGVVGAHDASVAVARGRRLLGGSGGGGRNEQTGVLVLVLGGVGVAADGLAGGRAAATC